ncbi:MAG: class I SAM-dependent methyltransferase [Thermoguttaceae bacterium]|nr:class I SAM-dependent methyltransferase [Thermoguttaceae bacterium]
MSETPSTLAETLQKYDIALSPGKIRRLEAYALELWQWNTKLNLTRHNDWDKFVTRDLIDSIRLAACLQKGESVLDVGTGGGVPGVLLTILRPDLRVDLCDSTGKKTVALGAILDAVGLKNNLWHAKGEELLRVRRYHTLVIRAVSKMDRLLTMFAPCWQAFDRLLMIKGPSWVEERNLSRHLGLLTNLALRKIDEYTVPGD